MAVRERAVFELLCLGFGGCDVSLASLSEVDKCGLKCEMPS